MECGVEDQLCQFLEWVSHNEFVASAIANLVAELGEQAVGLGSSFLEVVRQHIEKIIGLAGFSFGLYRWWKYREQILHKRLAEYLQENDRRLATSSEAVLAALQRPTPGQSERMPLFAPGELCAVLRERNWDKSAVAASVQSSALWQLGTAIEKIERRLESGQEMIESLRNQLATAHILSGAISASSAGLSRKSPADAHHAALTSFRTAQQIPGHEQSLLAKELEAHQLRKMGLLQQALQAYQIVESLASAVGDYRTQRLTAARAKRYQAEVVQMTARSNPGNDQGPFQGKQLAHSLVQEALQIRSNFTPYRGWERIEQGDLHYLAAFIAKNLGFVVVESNQLDAAETEYEGVLAEPRHGLLGDRGTRKRRQKAMQGIARIRQARAGDYDWRWLSSV